MIPVITSSIQMLLLSALGAYLLGAIPGGVVVARMLSLGDLRQIGSGNTGTTNVLRTGSKLGAALTLLLDGGKGALAVVIARVYVGEDASQVAALAAMIGHCFPVYLRFEGGKGVATFLGVLVASAPLLGLAAAATWLIVAVITRFSSGAALVCSGAAVGVALALYPAATTLTAAMTLLIWVRHRANIRRLLNGSEPKIGQK